MKHGTAYAKQVKRIYAKIKKQSAAPRIDEPTDPLEQLVLSVLSQETTLSNARKALDTLLSVMVDLNEIRVSSPREVAQIIDPHIPGSFACATRLCTLLNAVFNRKCNLSLDPIHSMGKRDAKRWLEELDGIEPYHVASVMLWSLGGHAIPVNNSLLAVLRREKLVDPETPVAEVQSFLERHISPAEAKTFCVTMADVASRKRTSLSKAKAVAKKPARKPNPKKKSSSKTARRKKLNQKR